MVKLKSIIPANHKENELNINIIVVHQFSTKQMNNHVKKMTENLNYLDICRPF